MCRPTSQRPPSPKRPDGKSASARNPDSEMAFTTPPPSPLPRRSQKHTPGATRASPAPAPTTPADRAEPGPSTPANTLFRRHPLPRPASSPYRSPFFADRYCEPSFDVSVLRGPLSEPRLAQPGDPAVAPGLKYSPPVGSKIAVCWNKRRPRFYNADRSTEIALVVPEEEWLRATVVRVEDTTVGEAVGLNMNLEEAVPVHMAHVRVLVIEYENTCLIQEKTARVAFMPRLVIIDTAWVGDPEHGKFFWRMADDLDQEMSSPARAIKFDSIKD